MQYVSCMNPTAGSFTINPRLQVKPHARPTARFSSGYLSVRLRRTAGRSCCHFIGGNSRICRVTVIPNGAATGLLPYSLVCFS